MTKIRFYSRSCWRSKAFLLFSLYTHPFSDWFFERGWGAGHSVQRDIQRHNSPRGLRCESEVWGQGISRADRDVEERGWRTHCAQRQRRRRENHSGWVTSWCSETNTCSGFIENLNQQLSRCVSLLMRVTIADATYPQGLQSMGNCSCKALNLLV